MLVGKAKFDDLVKVVTPACLRADAHRQAVMTKIAVFSTLFRTINILKNENTMSIPNYSMEFLITISQICKCEERASSRLVVS
ncbi:MAG: hypothetical protein JW932_05185 [Deltaproteobacteria bacterium]|nr:hypothetical protein [Deltaproteobacteria bacterium]